ncbi:MAG: hypothetical protein AABZ30_16520 [Myxococcota bacterium]
MPDRLRRRLGALSFALALGASACERGRAGAETDCPDGARGGLCVRFSTLILPPLDAARTDGQAIDAGATDTALQPKADGGADAPADAADAEAAK